MSRSHSTVAITGASGFIGRHLLEALAKLERRVLVVSRTAATVPAGNVEWLSGGLGDPKVLERVCNESSVIFHLAAQTSLQAGDADPIFDLDTNVGATLRLLEAVRATERRCAVIFASSATTIGVPESNPCNEDVPARPRSIYDIHKLTSELHLSHYVERGWVRGGSLRIANAYGAGLGSSKSDRCIINRMILRAISGEDLPLYGNGNYLRDYIHVDDICEAFIESAKHSDAMNGRSLFIGTGIGISLANAFKIVAEEVTAATGKAVKVIQVPEPASLAIIDRRNFIADTAAFNQLTRWKHKIDFLSGVRKTIASYVKTGQN